MQVRLIRQIVRRQSLHPDTRITIIRLMISCAFCRLKVTLIVLANQFLDSSIKCFGMELDVGFLLPLLVIRDHNLMGDTTETGIRFVSISFPAANKSNQISGKGPKIVKKGHEERE